jgi:hypothetical protein
MAASGRPLARAKRPKSTPRDQSESNLRLSVIKTVQIYQTVRALIWGGVIIGCFYVGVALPVKYSAGQETSITFVAKALLGMEVHIWLPYLVATGLAVLWKRERNLRKRTIRREHERVEAFEKKIDPNRTSSGFEE